ncbi:unnamed protein product [Heligmosomoides polygyrus]|uniref:Neuromedin-B n=1 Tax=Heligmosomoides polygyrus TaxID=6339 RepID=A0A183FW33_HELPZ|nr:unnamed protein product [Heligmosomoides polygyrus]
MAPHDLSTTGNGSYQRLFLQSLQRKATVGMVLRLVSSAEDPLCRSMDIDTSGRKHDAKTLLKQIFVYHNSEMGFMMPL